MENGLVATMRDDTPLRYISLFSGVGGFEVGLDSVGAVCVAQVEKDAKCRSVLARHHPDVPRLEDVRDAGKHNLPTTADLICGGSPCTDLSIAGRREGLAGEQSGLFFEFHRIVTELHPTWIVFENVPGLLSSGPRDPTTGRTVKGLDFAVVIAGFTGVFYDVPQGGWRKAGIAKGLVYHVAWRVLDSQYFGLAQRRQRVFLIGCTVESGRSPASVLLKPESLHGYPPTRRATRQGTAAALTGGAPERGRDGLDSAEGDALAAGDGADAAPLVAGTLAAAGARNRGLGQENETDFLIINGNSTPEISESVAFPLRANDGSGNRQAGIAPAEQAFRLRGFGDYAADDTSGPLKARDFKDAQDLVAVDVRNLKLQDEGVSGMLQAKKSGGHSLNYQNPVIFKGGQGSGGIAASDVTAPTLTQGDGTQVPNVAYGLSTFETPKFADDLSPTLTTPSPSGGGQPPAVATIAFDWQAGGSQHDKSFRGKARAYIVRKGDYAQIRRNAHDAVLQPITVQNAVIGRSEKAGPEGPGWRDDGKSFTLDSRGSADAVVQPIAKTITANYGKQPDSSNSSTPGNFVVNARYGLRRLMPVEAERLQGFEDGHTEFGADGERMSDSARYKMLGNAVSTTVIAAIARRIAAEEERAREKERQR